MANEKEAIKKLLTIVAKQQRIITKLAQAADPFNTPTGQPGDPLDPTINSPSQTAPRASAPAPEQKAKSAPEAAGGLPAEVKGALDAARMPALKGALLVTVNGKNLNIAFNADRVKDRPTDLKNKLNAALSNAGYTVTDILGHMNPAWKPNY
jgi:hypothetical protein